MKGFLMTTVTDLSQPVESSIRDIVRQVISELRSGAIGAETAAPKRPSNVGKHGVFENVNEAVAASQEAFEQLERLGLEGRRKAIGHIRRISIEQCEELGRKEFEETQIGRLEHKIEKLKILGERTPALSFFRAKFLAVTMASQS